MQTIGETRLENLNGLVRQAGSLEFVAAKVETTAIYLSQLRGRARDARTGRPREMGSSMARRIEVAFGKPKGWMDEPHYKAEATKPPPTVAESRVGGLHAVTVEKSLVLADVLRFASAEERRRVLDDIRVQLVHARAKYSAEEFTRHLDALDELDLNLHP